MGYQMSSKVILAATDVVFANSALVNTQKVVEITKPDTQTSNMHEIIIHNPSEVTDLTLKCFNVETEGDAYITSVIVPKKATTTGTVMDTYSIFIEGLFRGTDVKLVISNNTALGAAEGFTAKVKVREVA
ncbi:MAG: hypothetical protein JM58_16365 [Peptococcaceae bacterium BICA1-8]|nr:MAG: hypothetical protein JM58_16365 [Peptococcaceae bacterium BICA1-8]